MNRAQSEELLLFFGREHCVRGAHVEERRRATTARWQLACMEHRRRGGVLGIRVVGVKELEEPGPNVVAAQRSAAELLAQFLGHHESGVDHLPRLAVAQRSAVAGPADRILDRADQSRDGLQFLVGERVVETDAHHAAPP